MLKALVKRKALELGFDACGFTTAAPPGSVDHFDRWILSGSHGEMSYLARGSPKRHDLNLILNGVKSVVCLASSYHRQSPAPNRPSPAPTPTTGVVARYARFDDYHDVLSARLIELTRFIDQSSPTPNPSLFYTDTGPILERDLAQRAGLGFVGKHTNLINRTLGNWFFISEILTQTEFEPDPPEPSRCGSCSRCIPACPTAAITAPYTLDARRCISYLTIELKGPIPTDLRPLIGNRIFGCDDCLAACPWNRFAREGSILKGLDRPDLTTPVLIDLLKLDEPNFKSRFKGSPILRSKRRGFLRNVCVALGNTGDHSALPALDTASSDPEPLIAEHASWAANQIRSRHHTGR